MRKNSKHTKEARLNMSLHRLGHTTSALTRHKLGVANRDKLRTDSQRNCMSAAMKATMNSPVALCFAKVRSPAERLTVVKRCREVKALKEKRRKLLLLKYKQ